MLKVEPISLAILREDDLEGMMHAHWQETYPELRFDPDWTAAVAMEKAGVLKTYRLSRNGDTIGYAAFEVSPHLFFKSTKHAFNSAIYVTPEHRGFAGIFLARECEAQLRAEGVQRITYGAPTASALNRVLEGMGYEPMERLFTKVFK